MNRGAAKNIVLEMLKERETVKERDISDRMVDFVYNRLLPPVQEAFLDIASFFYINQCYCSRQVVSTVGEEEFRALEAASFVKTSEDGDVIVHDIVRARGKKLSDGNRITDHESLLKCLNNDERLGKLKGIHLIEESEKPPIEINCHDLNCMSNSLRVLRYGSRGSQITFRERCEKLFEQLRVLIIDGDVPDLPIPEFEKHLVYYWGPMTQGMNLYEFPPSLCYMYIDDYSRKRVAYSKITPKVTPDSSLVELGLNGFRNMPDGVEKLTKLERLTLWKCFKGASFQTRRSQQSKRVDTRSMQTIERVGATWQFDNFANAELLLIAFKFRRVGSVGVV